MNLTIHSALWVIMLQWACQEAKLLLSGPAERAEMSVYLREHPPGVGDKLKPNFCSKPIRVRTIHLGPTFLHDSHLNCTLRLDRDTIHCSLGSDRVKVITFYGTFGLHGENPSVSQFFGPVSILCGNCKKLVMASNICEKGLKITNPLTDYCYPEYHPLTIVLASTLGLLSLTLVLTIRYLQLRYFWSPSALTLISSHGSIMPFTTTYVEIEKESFFNHSLEDRKARAALIAVKRRRVCHISWTVFLAYALLMKAPVIDSVPLEFYTTHHTSQSEISMIGQSQVHINRSYLSMFLEEAYKTVDFESTPNIDYWCTAAGCDSNGPCSSYDPKGNWTTDFSWVHNDGDREQWFYKRYCMKPGPYCPFSNGCWKWDIRYKYNEEELWSVNRLGMPTPVIDVTTNLVEGDSLVYITRSSHHPLAHHSVLQHPVEGNWLCPFSDNRGTPSPGLLGDLQLFPGKKFAMSKESSVCVVNDKLGPSCHTTMSFMKSYKSLCTQLPTYVGGVLVDYRDNELMVNYEGDTEFVIRSKTPSKKEIARETCRLDHFKTYGVKHGFFPLMVIAITEPVIIGVEIEVTDLCSNRVITLNCGHGIHHIDMINNMTCLEGVAKVVHHEIEESIINVLKDHHLSGYQYTGSWISGLSDAYCNPRAWFLRTISGSSITFFIVILILFFLRK